MARTFRQETERYEKLTNKKDRRQNRDDFKQLKDWQGIFNTTGEIADLKEEEIDWRAEAHDLYLGTDYEFEY